VSPTPSYPGSKGRFAPAVPSTKKQTLIKRIVDSWCKITGQPKTQVLAGPTEIESDITMEYGLILPHPGGETEWFATNAEALDGIQGTRL
jgi:hypothetical protein